MASIIHGKIFGRTIELTEDLGLTEGQEVEVSVRLVPTASVRNAGDGLLRTEGALTDDPHWDAIMDEIHRERKDDTRREVPG
jgi:hypothetical protein